MRLALLGAGLLAGFLAGYLVRGEGRGGSRRGGAVATIDAEARRESEARRADVERLEAENLRLAERLRERERTDGAAGGATSGSGTAETDPGRARGRSTPRFLFAGTEKGLSAVAWDEAGGALAGLMPLLSEAVEVAGGRRPMRTELWGDLTERLGDVITYALRLEQAGVPWSHPSALANLVHATLREAGAPLDAAQEEALHRIGSLYVEEETSRGLSYGPRTLHLRRKLEEAALKNRFFAEVEAILSEAQRSILWPPGVKGLVGPDVFSGGGTWDDRLEPLPHRDRADLRARAAAAFGRDLDLREELHPALEAAVARWEATLPDGFLAEGIPAKKPDDLDMERQARVAETAARQIVLLESLLSAAALDGAETERLLRLERVHMIVRDR